MLTAQTKESGFSHIIILLIVLVIGGAGFAGWRVISTKNSQKSVKPGQSEASELKAGESDAVSQGMKSVIKVPSDNGQSKDVSVNPALFYDVTTADKHRFFGRITKINEEYFRLSDVLYLKNNSVLTQLGSELHGPEPAMYIQTAKVSQLHELNPSQSEYKTVTEFAGKNTGTKVSDASPSSVISEYIKPAQYQAVFFDDGKVYYAKLKSLSGTFLAESAKVYVLRTNSAPGSAQTDVSLVLTTREEVSKYTKNQLIYWENLRPDSQISTAISQHQQ